MTAILIFACTEGAGVGDHSAKKKEKKRKIFRASPQTAPRPLSSFDTHWRWQPVMQSAWGDDLTEK